MHKSLEFLLEVDGACLGVVTVHTLNARPNGVGRGSGVHDHGKKVGRDCAIEPRVDRGVKTSPLSIRGRRSRCFDMIIESVLAESNLEKATPLGVVASLEIEGDGDESFDARNGDGLRREGSLGNQLLLGSDGSITHGERSGRVSGL